MEEKLPSEKIISHKQEDDIDTNVVSFTYEEQVKSGKSQWIRTHLNKYGQEVTKDVVYEDPNKDEFDLWDAEKIERFKNKIGL